MVAKYPPKQQWRQSISQRRHNSQVSARRNGQVTLGSKASAKSGGQRQQRQSIRQKNQWQPKVSAGEEAKTSTAAKHPQKERPSPLGSKVSAKSRGKQQQRQSICQKNQWLLSIRHGESDDGKTSAIYISVFLVGRDTSGHCLLCLLCNFHSPMFVPNVNVQWVFSANSSEYFFICLWSWDVALRYSPKFCLEPVASFLAGSIDNAIRCQSWLLTTTS